MRFLAILKVLVVISLLYLGTAFLLRHAGVELPMLKYKSLEAQNIPAGVVLLVAGVAIAKFWRVRWRETRTEQTTTTYPDGSSTTTTTTIDTGAKLFNKWP
jgi:hypothetical protein